MSLVRGKNTIADLTGDRAQGLPAVLSQVQTGKQNQCKEFYYVLIGLHQQTTKYMESPKNGTLSMVT